MDKPAFIAPCDVEPGDEVLLLAVSDGEYPYIVLKVSSPDFTTKWIREVEDK